MLISMLLDDVEDGAVAALYQVSPARGGRRRAPACMYACMRLRPVDATVRITVATRAQQTSEQPPSEGRRVRAGAGACRGAGRTHSRARAAAIPNLCHASGRPLCEYDKAAAAAQRAAPAAPRAWQPNAQARAFLPLHRAGRPLRDHGRRPAPAAPFRYQTAHPNTLPIIPRGPRSALM